MNFGNGDKYAKDTGRKASVTYRIPYESFLDLPNKFVGPKKCGECHPAQYERWERSRHNKIVRFPEELTEPMVAGDMKKPSTAPRSPFCRKALTPTTSTS